MLKLDPGRSPYDLHIQLFGIPVQVHPWFWVAAFLLTYPASSGRGDILLLGILAMILSILVHEFGHALAMRYFAIPARVVLYHFGGLAIPLRSEYESFMPRKSNTRQNILILVAGPGAGFLLATLVAVLIMATGGSFELHTPNFQSSTPLQFWEFELPVGWNVVKTENASGAPDLRYTNIRIFFSFLFQFNIYWGLMNLIPVLPLDGGQILREVLSIEDSYSGMRQALQISCILGVIVGVLGFAILEQRYVGVMFLLLAYSNYASWQQLGQRFS